MNILRYTLRKGNTSLNAAAYALTTLNVVFIVRNQARRKIIFLMNIPGINKSGIQVRKLTFHNIKFLPTGTLIRQYTLVLLPFLVVQDSQSSALFGATQVAQKIIN